MPKVTSVASTQKKYEVEQGRVVGEQNFRKFAKFRKMSKTVDSARVIHPHVCSFATEEHSCSARSSVAHTWLVETVYFRYYTSNIVYRAGEFAANMDRDYLYARGMLMEEII